LLEEFPVLPLESFQVLSLFRGHSEMYFFVEGDKSIVLLLQFLVLSVAVAALRFKVLLPVLW
jgi:hypothetical protein